LISTSTRGQFGATIGRPNFGVITSQLNHSLRCGSIYNKRAPWDHHANGAKGHRARPLPALRAMRFRDESSARPCVSTRIHLEGPRWVHERLRQFDCIDAGRLSLAGSVVRFIRFDGAVPWSPPVGQQLPSHDVSNDILAVVSGRDVTLWIATREGLAGWKDGKLTRVSKTCRAAHNLPERIRTRAADATNEDSNELLPLAEVERRHVLRVLEHVGGRCRQPKSRGSTGPPYTGSRTSRTPVKTRQRAHRKISRRRAAAWALGGAAGDHHPILSANCN